MSLRYQCVQNTHDREGPELQYIICNVPLVSENLFDKSEGGFLPAVGHHSWRCQRLMLLTSNYKQVSEQLKVDVTIEGKEGKKMFLGGIKIL